MQGFNSGHFGSGLRRVSCFGGAVLCVLLLATQGFGQADTGTILGTVFDPSGAVIPGATVTIVNEQTAQKVELQANSTGDFATPGLAAVGYYTVTVSKEGFAPVERTHVKLNVSDRVALRFTLQPGRQVQAITVSSGAPIVDAASSTLGGIVSDRDTMDLPTNGRDVSQLLELVPGVNVQGGGGVVNGSSLFANAGDTILLLVDGADASRVDCMCVDNNYGTPNRITRASVDDVEEFRFYDGAYSAEFGGLAGVMNVVTKSGTNQFHGDFYEFLRNEKFDARNYFDPVPLLKPPFRLNQFGGTLGGPIKRDKLFFFLNYEGVRQRLGSSGVSYVPTQSLLAIASPAVLPYLTQLPPPNGPAVPGYPYAAEYLYQLASSLTEDSGSAKLTYSITPTKRLDVHWNMEKFNAADPYGAALGQDKLDVGFNQNAKVTFTDNITPTILNTAYFAPNRMHIDPRASNNPTVLNEPETTWGLLGFSEVGPFVFDLQVANNSFSYGDTLAWVKGRNQIKFGGEVIWNQDNKALDMIHFDNFGFPTLAETLQGIENNDVFGLSTLNQPRAGARNQFFNFFGQDDIQASKKLTINAGLRYQYDTEPHESHYRAVNWSPVTDLLDPIGTSLGTQPKLDFGPRLGLAYSPFESRKTVLRAGFGIYFAPMMAAEFQNIPSNTDSKSYGYTIYDQPAGSGPAGFAPLTAFPFPPLTFFTSAPLGTVGIWAAQRKWNASREYAWNFTIQQELSANTRLQVAYVGNHGEHLVGPPPNLNVFDGYFYSHGPFSNWSSVEYLSDQSTQSYDSLQVSLNHRFSHGWTLNFNYTLSHCWDNEPQLFASYQDGFNPMLDYGNCDNDIRQALEFNYIYAFPSIPHVPGAVGSGWQLNGITTMRSGLPYTVVCGCDPNEGLGGAYADSVIGVSRTPTNFNMPGNQLNLAAFYAPPSGLLNPAWGNSGRNSNFGPSAFNWDIGIMKHFKVREGQNIEFRAELFNIANTPQFNNPNATITSPVGFGQSTSTIGTVDGFGTDRQIQFALKYVF